MTDKLHCPWCGDELIFAHKLKGIQTCVCRNPTCKYDGYHFPVEVIQQLIDGKKTQDALKVALDGLNELADPTLTDANYRDSVLTQFGLNRAVNHIKDKITSITKQEE